MNIELFKFIIAIIIFSIISLLFFIVIFGELISYLIGTGWHKSYLNQISNMEDKNE